MTVIEKWASFNSERTFTPKLCKQYFNRELEYTTNKGEKSDLLTVFKQSISLLEEEISSSSTYSFEEHIFYISAANINRAFNTAYNARSLIEKIYLTFCRALGCRDPLLYYHDQLISKIASQFIKKYFENNLQDLIKNKLLFTNEYAAIDLTSLPFPETEKDKIPFTILQNRKYIIPFLEKAISIEKSNILNRPDATGIIHEITNTEGGKTFLIGTLHLLPASYIQNTPIISEKLKQSSLVIAECAKNIFSNNSIDAGYVSLAYEKGIPVISLESRWDQITVLARVYINWLSSIFFSNIAIEDSSENTDELVADSSSSIDSLIIQDWQKGIWRESAYLKNTPSEFTDIVFKNREKKWLSDPKINLLNIIQDTKQTICIIVGVGHITGLLKAFEDDMRTLQIRQIV